MPYAMRLTSRLCTLGLGLTACSDGISEPGKPPHLSFVSDPIETSLRHASSSAASVVHASGVVYVSLPAATFPNATRALIRQRASRVEFSVPIIDGGVDPVAVHAALGDTLELLAKDNAGTTLETMVATVPASRRPYVVRTIPSRGKTDVPLNARITIVFSEPMDPATVDGSTVRLMSSAGPTLGEIVVDADGLRADIRSNEILAAGTNYTIEVTTAVADLAGDRLSEVFRSTFSTGTTTEDGPSGARAASVTVSPDTITAHTGTGPLFWLRATVRDAHGNQLNDVSVSWSSSDSALARPVDPEPDRRDRYAAYVMGMGKTGSVTITARVTGSTAQGSATLLLEDLGGIALNSISVGETGVCLVTASGRIFCQGDMGYGLYTWVQARSELAFTNVSLGWGQHCALATGGAAYCWSDRDSPTTGMTLVAVGGGLTFKQVTSERFNSCGLTAAGAAYCWGEKWVGSTPVPIPGGLSFSKIDAAQIKTCGLTISGDVYCWGGAYTPDDSVDWRNPAPVPVAIGLGLTDVSVGYGFAGSGGPGNVCALTVEGAPLCWTSGSVAPSPSLLVALPAGVSLKQIDSGIGPHTCGITSDGSVYCWGRRYNDDLHSQPFEPTRVADLTLRSLSSGSGGFDYIEGVACGVGTDGLGYCWVSAAGTWNGPAVGPPWRAP